MSNDDRDRETGADLTEAQAQKLADYIAGRLSPQARSAVEREILASSAMSRALYEDAGIVAMVEEEVGGTTATGIGAAAAAETGAVAPVASLGARARRRAPWLAALPIAAGIVLALLVPQLLRRSEQARDAGMNDDFRFRSALPDTTGSAGAPERTATGSEHAPRGLEPVGRVTAVPAFFAWSRDTSADAYRVEVSAADGRIVFARTTADTSLAIAEGELPLAPGDGASWRVVPLIAGVPRPASQTVSFEIAP